MKFGADYEIFTVGNVSGSRLFVVEGTGISINNTLSNLTISISNNNEF